MARQAHVAVSLGVGLAVLQTLRAWSVNTSALWKQNSSKWDLLQMVDLG
jgi:hypothetical protein